MPCLNIDLREFRTSEILSDSEDEVDPDCARFEDFVINLLMFHSAATLDMFRFHAVSERKIKFADQWLLRGIKRFPKVLDIYSNCCCKFPRFGSSSSRLSRLHLNEYYEQNHRVVLVEREEVPPLLHLRGHNPNETLLYDPRYEPYFRRIDLFQFVLNFKGTPPWLNAMALTALTDRWTPETHSFHLPLGEMTYLFVICAEGLSALLHDAECTGKITRVKVCPNAPVVSHLLFADDFVLLMKANQAEGTALREVLDLYEKCSGQCINLEKSAIMFSPNTKEDEKVTVKNALQIHSESLSEKYLGLHVHVGKSKRKAFAYIKGGIAGRIYGCKEKLIAKVGKETLVKGVAQAIPTYAMSCFDLTKTFCKEISSLIGNYWWSQQDKDNTTH